MQRRLDYLCQAYWWFDDGIIEGEPFGRLLLGVTVSARDQWWCLQRATDLATEIFAIAGVRRPPYPVWDRVESPRNSRSRYATPAEYVAASD